jgi:hypothetical protein
LRETDWRLENANGQLYLSTGDAETTASPSAISELNALLVARGFNVHHLSLRQPSLESLFLQMTQGDA